jgi:bifunctional non-homologous end joining protein LigD
VPYLDRRAALAELVPSHGTGLPVQAPPHWLGLSADTMLGVARETGMEGCVFKKVSSIYLPGKRTRSWMKSLIRQRMSAVVIGWIPGGGAQRNVVGSLVLGAYNREGVLVHIGQVGTGFTASMRRQLCDQLEQLECPTSPLTASSTHPDAPRGVHWVEPRMVVEVEFRELNEAAGGLRHSSYKAADRISRRRKPYGIYCSSSCPDFCSTATFVVGSAALTLRWLGFDMQTLKWSSVVQ